MALLHAGRRSCYSSCAPRTRGSRCAHTRRRMCCWSSCKTAERPTVTAMVAAGPRCLICATRPSSFSTESTRECTPPRTTRSPSSAGCGCVCRPAFVCLPGAAFSGCLACCLLPAYTGCTPATTALTLAERMRNCRALRTTWIPSSVATGFSTSRPTPPVLRSATRAQHQAQGTVQLGQLSHQCPLPFALPVACWFLTKLHSNCAGY